MSLTRYWMAAISKEHTQRGVAGNFIQVCHGKYGPLKRMKKDDYVIVYSSKISMDRSEKCQAFTAIGQVSDDLIFPFQMTAMFRPFRRKVKFFPCSETPIVPLIDSLDFIKSKKAWGYPFRFGFFEITESDFEKIASKMLQHEIIG